MSDVFISYSRRDLDYVQRLARELDARGKEAWIDTDGIRDAEVFPAALRRAIESSDAFVFVISPDSVRSPFCEQEVEHAVELNKRVVPLALHEVPDEEIPEEIRVRNWIPATDDADFETSVERLVNALETDLEWEREHTRLTVRALEWEQAGRDRSFVLRGAELRSAEAWLAAGADKDRGPTALETEYLIAGRRAAARRQRGLVITSLAVAAVSVGLLIFALISRGEAISQALTSDAERVGAQAVAERNLDLAMLYAVAAVKLQNRLETRSDLLTVLQDNPDAIRLLRLSQNEIRVLAVNRAGQLLATGDSAGVVRFENMSTWTPSGRPLVLTARSLKRGWRSPLTERRSRCSPRPGARKVPTRRGARTSTRSKSRRVESGSLGPGAVSSPRCRTRGLRLHTTGQGDSSRSRSRLIRPTDCPRRTHSGCSTPRRAARSGSGSTRCSPVSRRRACCSLQTERS